MWQYTVGMVHLKGHSGDKHFSRSGCFSEGGMSLRISYKGGN